MTRIKNRNLSEVLRRSKLSEEQKRSIKRLQVRDKLDKSAVIDVVKSLEKLPSDSIDVFLCGIDYIYFIRSFVKIYDPEERIWIRFDLWPAQQDLLHTFRDNKFVIVLKTRQVGITWCALAYALWLCLFRPIATVLLYSLRDDEAVELLGPQRFLGMYRELPGHIKSVSIEQRNTHRVLFDNRSIVHALPTTRGDSYTATLVVVDEADLVPNLNDLLDAAKPTVEAGGQVLLVSRSDKDNPMSDFKQIYRGAKKGKGRWEHVFLPWNVHPGRTQEWYEVEKEDIYLRTGGYDSLYKNYPSTDEEALAPAVENKRIPGKFLERCFNECDVLPIPDELSLYSDLKVFEYPNWDRRYYIGGDCAEGLATGNNSATIVVDDLGAEVCNWVGKHSPEYQAKGIRDIAKYYHHARIMIENNNHGYSALSWLINNNLSHLLARGWNKKQGWTSNRLGKLYLYDTLADLVQSGDVELRDYSTYYEIQSINKDTLLAPRGLADDRADAFALAQVARVYGRNMITVSLDVLD